MAAPLNHSTNAHTSARIMCDSFCYKLWCCGCCGLCCENPRNEGGAEKMKGKKSRGLPIVTLPVLGKVWLVYDDACGIFCSLFGYFVVGITAYATNKHVLLSWMPPGRTFWGGFHFVVYNTVIGLIFLAHVRTMCCNPGSTREHLPRDLSRRMRMEYDWQDEEAARMQDELRHQLIEEIRAERAEASDDEFADDSSDDEDVDEAYIIEKTTRRRRWCAHCNEFKPRYAHHCRTCNTCVVDMDHVGYRRGKVSPWCDFFDLFDSPPFQHCPWVNNCVGWRNHKTFLLYLLYVYLGSTYSVSLMLYRVVYCVRYAETGEPGCR